jgi:hypothetical protein
MLTNNTRKYHRSSILAFPNTTDYACALTRSSPSTEGISKVILYGFVALFIVYVGYNIWSIV